MPRVVAVAIAALAFVACDYHVHHWSLYHCTIAEEGGEAVEHPCPTGPQGEQGPQGESGPQGEQGPQGPAGPPYMPPGD